MLFSYNDLLGCFHTFFLVSVRYPLFYCWRFLRHALGFTKVCWTMFYATTLTVFSRSAFSEFATQCSTQSFHEVAYLCITSPVFARFLRNWQVNVFRNIFACSLRFDSLRRYLESGICKQNEQSEDDPIDDSESQQGDVDDNSTNEEDDIPQSQSEFDPWNKFLQQAYYSLQVRFINLIPMHFFLKSLHTP